MGTAIQGNQQTKHFRATGEHSLHASVQLFIPSTATTEKGIVRSYSMNELYVESQSEIAPGTTVHVTGEDPDSQPIFPSILGYFMASVSRVQPMQEGVQKAYGMEMKVRMSACDACSYILPADKLQTFPGPISLCPDCLDVEKGLPDGKLKTTLEQFLMGNVL